MSYERFYYRGYLVEIKGPVNHHGRLTVTASTSLGPEFSEKPKCSCNGTNGFLLACHETIDKQRSPVEQEVEAKRLATAMRQQIQQAINFHINTTHS